LATFGERFKELRLDKKITQDKLAQKFYIQKSSISKYENNVHIPEIESLQKFSDYFGVTVDYLLGRTDYKTTNSPQNIYNGEELVRIPVLGTIRAGKPSIVNEDIIGYEYVPSNQLQKGDCFFLRVSGDSMNLSRILDGDLVLVRRQAYVENGEIGVIIIDGENATIKRIYNSDKTFTLIPHSSNPEHNPRIIDSSKINVEIIGKVIQAIIKF
jgi:repressor LexA